MIEWRQFIKEYFESEESEEMKGKIKRFKEGQIETYIVMECQDCGFKGLIPADMVQYGMMCKKCGSGRYIDIDRGSKEEMMKEHIDDKNILEDPNKDLKLIHIKNTEVTPSIIENKEIYARIGDGKLSKISRKNAIDIEDIYKAKFYILMEEETNE